MNKFRSRFLLSLGLLFLFVVALVAIWVLSPVQRSLAQTSQASNSITSGLRQSALVNEYLTGMKKLRAGGLTAAQREKLSSQMAGVRQRLKDLRNQMRVSSGALPFGPAPKTSEALPINSQNVKNSEKCVACKYVMGQIAQDVGGKLSVQAIQASFEQNCLNAQKAPGFYEACEEIYADLYAMTDDYMASGYDPTIVCQKADMCP